MAKNYNRRSDSSGSKRNNRNGNNRNASSKREASTSRDRGVGASRERTLGTSRDRSARSTRRPQTSDRRSSNPARSSRLAGSRRSTRPSDAARSTRVNHRGITIAEQRKRTRQAARKKQGATLSVRLLIVLGIVVLLVVAAFLVYRSPAFFIESKEVKGAVHLTNEYVLEIAAVAEDSTLLRIDATDIAQRLTADSWIAEAKIERKFPSTLVLAITERTPVAVVEIQPTVTSQETESWLLSQDGIWLGTVNDLGSEYTLSSEELSSLVKIIEVSRSVQPAVGEKVTDEGIQGATTILNTFSEEMRPLVASISAPNRSKISLSLINNVVVTFGAAEDIPAKETAIITLLNAHPDTLISINVRIPNRATFSSYGD